MTHPVYSASLPQAIRDGRARELVRGHARQIAESAHGALDKVPSCRGVGVYVVSLARQTCGYTEFEHPCQTPMHPLLAEIVDSNVGHCADRGKRFLRRDLREVTEEHESPTWCVGDLLCRTCVLGHGVL